MFKTDFQSYFRVIAIAAIVFAIGHFVTDNNRAGYKPVINEKSQSAFERVRETRTLRCGYVIIPPEFARDANSGKFSGFSFDVAEELGRRLHWKIEWTQETNFGTMSEDLKANRFDALCFSLYRYSPIAGEFDYSVPMFYTGTNIYVRANDHRFDGRIAAINNPNVTIAAIDAEMSQFIARDDFPLAKTYSMPQNTSLSEMMLAVQSQKADVAINNASVAAPYLLANPGALRELPLKKPIRIFSHGFAVKKGETELISTINTVFEEMHNDGTMGKFIAAHEKIPGTFLRVAQPYRTNDEE